MSWMRSFARALMSGSTSVIRLRSFISAVQPEIFCKEFNRFMSHPKSIFLTGATGFLGSHLTSRLLSSGRTVKALARPSKNASAKDRVEEILREVGVNHFENLTVVEGDISLPDLGLNES